MIANRFSFIHSFIHSFHFQNSCATGRPELDAPFLSGRNRRRTLLFHMVSRSRIWKQLCPTFSFPWRDNFAPTSWVNSWCFSAKKRKIWWDKAQHGREKHTEHTPLIYPIKFGHWNSIFCKAPAGIFLVHISFIYNFVVLLSFFAYLPLSTLVPLNFSWGTRHKKYFFEKGLAKFPDNPSWATLLHSAIGIIKPNTACWNKTQSGISG